MGSSGAALLVVALALHGVEAQQLSGVPQLTDDEFSRLSTCVGDRAAQRVNNSIARWSEPCLAVWNSPVWNSRRLEAELTRPWEEVLWQLVFREDLNNIGGTASPVPCVPVSSTSASVPATLLEGGPFARQTTTASSAEEVFAAGCALRGSSFLTATDEIDMRTVNDTLASFNVSQALRQTLEQNRQTCVQFSNSIDVSQLTLPLRNELGRQLAFFDCCLRLLLSSCDTFRQQQEAIGGILANGTVNGTIDDILNSILAG
ncbi:uncharacterized protein LOC108680709 isoform X2 [Hyalella azteca]|uniref:Uncharacterized protein LOC108680709 isoform X2 n=1 Tax=Hyalella azteca TaxID=294128 RepID=A0A8B7PHT9_HYAAZ|nr:uncharacterized protein LOC108680709 isoform X2 [Hyalella azteca]